MIIHVFTYGSLMYEPVWSRVVSGVYPSQEAMLSGYKRRKVINESFPAILPGTNDDIVEGRLYFNIRHHDLKLLDRFEGELYRRQVVECQNPEGERFTAHAYVFRQRHRHMVSEQAWDPEWFERTGIKIFMKRYAGLK